GRAALRRLRLAIPHGARRNRHEAHGELRGHQARLGRHELVQRADVARRRPRPRPPGGHADDAPPDQVRRGGRARWEARGGRTLSRLTRQGRRSMSETSPTADEAVNSEQREYWEREGDHWVREADRYDAMNGPFGEAMLDAAGLG